MSAVLYAAVQCADGQKDAVATVGFHPDAVLRRAEDLRCSVVAFAAPSDIELDEYGSYESLLTLEIVDMWSTAAEARAALTAHRKVSS